MYKSCKNILIALLFGNYLSIKKDWMNIIFFYIVTLITFMQKIDYQGFFLYKINEIYLRLQNIR